MTSQYAFYFDQTACNGCKVCTIACKSKNQLPVGINWRRVIQYGGGSWTPDPEDRTLMVPSNIFAYSFSVACMHCESPLCAEVCPTAAITKREDGVVLIDSDKCIGCRYCEWACPYGAPAFNTELGYMTKCDFCVDELDSGGEPYCVGACVMRALEFGELDELRAKYGNEAAIEPLPSAEITGPALVIKPHRNAQASGEGTGEILSLPEEV